MSNGDITYPHFSYFNPIYIVPPEQILDPSNEKSTLQISFL